MNAWVALVFDSCFVSNRPRTICPRAFLISSLVGNQRATVSTAHMPFLRCWSSSNWRDWISERVYVRAILRNVYTRVFLKLIRDDRCISALKPKLIGGGGGPLNPSYFCLWRRNVLCVFVRHVYECVGGVCVCVSAYVGGYVLAWHVRFSGGEKYIMFVWRRHDDTSRRLDCFQAPSRFHDRLRDAV